ncbi:MULTISPECIES: glycine betaine/L-proline ABC transporter ATP-binding protein [Pseudomonas]|jgi:glycine betaine/proline transport system ATP-binding protein|uniref:quaternary amine ABC transporter ATP-binding protein n=1 Tax=Pseudomonas TaxID=286 RepID=UPI0009CADD17|nr:glycine betaine/L-proline ABC transporter ATP-binding protein [Pseudomonas sp. VI4.1]OPK10976.1 proline/glycine betaine ABC transporter ATP-binding protein [Pseudomonas sp. VI4.1]
MATDQSNDFGIEIRHLYKIFGYRAHASIERVKQGMSKTELLSKHSHVLGLKDINISMPSGGIQVIMGLSGSGKSTLIRHINRLIDPTAGEVLVGGVDVLKMSQSDLREFRRHRISMVFQKFALLPNRTVLDNAVYGLEIQGLSRGRQVEIATGWLDRVGLKGYERHYPNQLSGGMQQRVGLARALASDAPILLMDEAFSALDPLIRMDMQSVLLDLQKEIRKTIVFITHDLDEALRIGDRIAILRDGEVVQQGTRQEIVMNPADDYIANFVKEVNRGRVISVEAIMRPFVGVKPGATLAVAMGTSLESAVQRLVEAGLDELVVTDGRGQPVGQLALKSIIATMVTSTVSEASPVVQSRAVPEATRLTED